MFREFRVGTVCFGYFFSLGMCPFGGNINICVSWQKTWCVFLWGDSAICCEYCSPTSLLAAGLTLGIFLCSVIQHDWAAPGGSSCPGMQPGPGWGHVGGIKSDKLAWNFWELLAFPSSSWGNECQEFSALTTLCFTFLVLQVAPWIQSGILEFSCWGSVCSRLNINQYSVHALFALLYMKVISGCFCSFLSWKHFGRVFLWGACSCFSV